MINDQLSLALGEEIDRVADEFESACRQQGKTSLKDYLPKVPSSARPHLLRELIRLDWDYRKRRGENPRLADYQAEFSRTPGGPQDSGDGPPLLTPDEWESLQAELCGARTAMPATAEDANALPTISAPKDAEPKPPGAKPSRDPLPADMLRRIGKYVVTSVLDSGGQAVVCRAVHPSLGCEVAIKLAHDPMEASAARPDALAEEGRILAQLQHPGIARVFDLDFHEGRLFLAMEYIRGRNLAQYAKDGITSREAAQIVAAAARALAAAHRAGVLHLDLKPTNIIIDEAGQPRLIDFGLARVRGGFRDDPPAPGMVSGTLVYMPPEQARGESDKLGPRSDLFSLGGVLFYLLTGRAPYQMPEEESLQKMLVRAQHGIIHLSPLHKPSISARMRDICQKALSQDPSQRYASGDEFADALDRAVRPLAPRLWLATGIAVIAIAALPVAKWAWRTPTPTPVAATTPVAPVVPADASAIQQPLQVKIQRGEKLINYDKANGMHAGDQIHMTASVAPGHYGTLVSFSSSGETRLLAQCGPDDIDRELRFPPAGQDASGTVDDKTGTEVIVVIASHGEPIGVEQLKACWPDYHPWPALDQGQSVTLSGDKVLAYGKKRDFTSPDHSQAVRELLEQAKKGLSLRYRAVAGGIAISHVAK